MPEEGVQLSPNKDILTTAEVHYLSALFVNQGVTKIRLTGGEPTVRKDIIPLMQQLGSLRQNGLKEIALTTNAISFHRKLDQMVEAGLTGVNTSLDTLTPHQLVLLTLPQRLHRQPQLLLNLIHRLVVQIRNPRMHPQHRLRHRQLVLPRRQLIVHERAGKLVGII